MFARAGDELLEKRGRPALGAPLPEPDDLYARLGELGFVAFVYRGEREGRIRLEAFRDHFAAAGEARTVAVFDAVLVDERRHEEYTGALLQELAGTPQLARRALRRVAAWEAYQAFRRAGRALVEPIWTVLSVVVFVTLFPLAWFLRRRVRSGWQ